MKLFAAAEPFNGQEIFFLSLTREEGAGENAPAVHQQRTGAAAAVIARPLRTGEIQSIPEYVVQRPVRIDLELMNVAVDLEGNFMRLLCIHFAHPKAFAPAPPL